MKPDYKNWIPKGMLVSLIAGTVLSFALLLVFGIFGIGVGGKLRVVLGVVFGIAFVVCAKCTEWCVYAYRSFSYDGERKLSKQNARWHPAAVGRMLFSNAPAGADNRTAPGNNTVPFPEISAPLIFVGAVTCCDASYLAAHCRISHRKRRSPPQA